MRQMALCGHCSWAAEILCIALDRLLDVCDFYGAVVQSLYLYGGCSKLLCLPPAWLGWHRLCKLLAKIRLCLQHKVTKARPSSLSLVARAFQSHCRAQ